MRYMSLSFVILPFFIYFEATELHVFGEQDYFYT